MILVGAAVTVALIYWGPWNMSGNTSKGTKNLASPSTNPQAQVVDNEKAITTGTDYLKFYAVINNTLWSWPEVNGEVDFANTKPTIVMDGVYKILRQSNYFLKLNSTMWKFPGENKSPTFVFRNVKDFREGYQGQKYLLTNDGNLFSSKDDWQKPILTDVKQFTYYGEGEAIKNDGSLWGFGKSDFYGLGAAGRINIDPEKPFKIMDKVKDVELVWDDGPLLVGVVKKDNSFWIWGSYNSNNEGYNDKRLRISDNVKDFSVHPWYGGFVLKSDSTLWRWATRTKSKALSKLADNVAKIHYPYFLTKDGDLYTIDYNRRTNLNNEGGPIKKVDNVLSFVRETYESETIATLKSGRVWSEVYGLLPEDVLKYFDSGFAVKKDGTVWKWGEKPVKLELPI